jgi:hypothetical protein
MYWWAACGVDGAILPMSTSETKLQALRIYDPRYLLILDWEARQLMYGIWPDKRPKGTITRHEANIMVEECNE